MSHEERPEDSQDLTKPILKLLSRLVVPLLVIGTSGALTSAWYTYLAVRDHSSAIERLASDVTAKAAAEIVARHEAKIEALENATRGSERALERIDRKIEILCVRLGKNCKE